MKLPNFSQLLEQYISRAVLIKGSLLLFIFFTVTILYAEQFPPSIISFEEFNSQPLKTPLSIEAKFNQLYTSQDFSVIELYSNTTNLTITAILQSNSSELRTQNPNQTYLFSGKVSTYRGEKQLDIYSIQTTD